MSDSSSPSGGVTAAGTAGIIFIVLKLTDVIDWSWWWVLSPFWIPAATTVVVLGVVALIALWRVS